MKIISLYPWLGKYRSQIQLSKLVEAYNTNKCLYSIFVVKYPRNFNVHNNYIIRDYKLWVLSMKEWSNNEYSKRMIVFRCVISYDNIDLYHSDTIH